MWPALLPVIGSLLDKFFPNPAEAAEAKLKLMQMAQTGELAQLDADLKLATGQMDVNKVEAANPSLLVSGWRPFVGWICGFSLCYAAIIEPIARFVAMVVYQYTGTFPVIDTAITMQLLIGLLGLGAYRSYEKGKGVASK